MIRLTSLFAVAIGGFLIFVKEWRIIKFFAAHYLS
jgi:hypothetical protein